MIGAQKILRIICCTPIPWDVSKVRGIKDYLSIELSQPLAGTFSRFGKALTSSTNTSASTAVDRESAIWNGDLKKKIIRWTARDKKRATTDKPNDTVREDA